VPEPEGGLTAEEVGELRFEARCRAVPEDKLLPWAVLKGDEVYFKASLVDELRPLIGDVGGLKSIAELMGWEYRYAKIGGKVARVVVASLGSLLKLLSGKVEGWG